MLSLQTSSTEVPTASDQRTVTSWMILLAPALPALAIALVWWSALPASFQFDDWNVIVHDPRVQSLAAWWQSMPGIRPLLKLTYTLNASISLEPFGFRLVNVSIHAINATLMWWLLRERGLRAGLSAVDAQRAAVLAALLFAVHPVQTEAVTYISGRSSSLAACFCLLSAYCWVRSEHSDEMRSSCAWLAGCCATFLAAIACKETAFVLPFALTLYSADRPFGTTLKRLTPLAVVMLIAALAALSLPTYRHLLRVSLDTRSFSENLLTQAHALVYLAGQLVRIFNGSADPRLPVITGADLTSGLLCAGWLFALAIAVVKLRKSPVGSFAVLWFLLWLAPTNSLLARLDVANDRQLYLALVGPAWWISVRLTAIYRMRPALIGIATTTLFIALIYATAQRNLIYDTEVTFWQDTAARNRSSARAANNLGMAYAIDCQFDAAAGEFQRAIELDPADYRASINLLLLRRSELPGAEKDRCSNHAP